MGMGQSGKRLRIPSARSFSSILSRISAIMPLDPQAKLLLDAIGITSAPGIETLTPSAARERSKLFAEIRRQMGVEGVDQVWGKRIPGPAGEIPIRVYSPETSKPAP